MSEVLRCENLHKVFITGDEKIHVLRGIDLVVEKGECVSIMGPSGVGKSTLLHILGGLERPTEGKVWVDGEEIYKKSDREISEIRNKKIGFVFQFHHLLSGFTALENVMIPMFMKGVNTEDAKKKALSLLSEVGMLERKDHIPSKLSGGERQRIAIARALANDPLILFLDEPTGNLDEEHAREVLELIESLIERRKLTVLLVTHNERVAKIGKRMYNLIGGKLEERNAM
ncbi:lipoprotein-releasing system ATP-binding protein LolD [bacterium]|nr:MAG: lipoprotein-releasing system ATP-binding protein LolD [bacterium]